MKNFRLKIWYPKQLYAQHYVCLYKNLNGFRTHLNMEIEYKMSEYESICVLLERNEMLLTKKYKMINKDLVMFTYFTFIFYQFTE